MLFRMFSWGGASMNAKSSRFSTPSDLSSKTTLPKFVRWISGTCVSSSSSRNCRSVYRR